MATEIKPRRPRQSTIDKYIGERFGRWTVLSYSHTTPPQNHYFISHCACGTTRPVLINSLKHGLSVSCGCFIQTRPSGIQQRTIDKYVGKKYGFWTVLSYSHRLRKKVYFTCQCDCGTIKPVFIHDMRNGTNKSCGCYKPPCRLPPGEAALTILINVYRCAARKRGHAFDLTRDEFRAIVSQNCFYCENLPSMQTRVIEYNSSPFVYNGIDRVDNDLGYTFENCVPCCRSCNFKKGKITKELVYKVYHRLFNNEPPITKSTVALPPSPQQLPME